MKKYILAKDLPDHPAGTPLNESGNRTWFTPNYGNTAMMEFKESDLKRAIENGWVKEVEDRIGLRPLGRLIKSRVIKKKDDTPFTPEEITLMEKALNGELMEKVDLQEFVRWFLKQDTHAAHSGMTHAELLEAFNNREK